MGKLDNLEKKLKKVTDKASLKSNKEKETKNILIYFILMFIASSQAQ